MQKFFIINDSNYIEKMKFTFGITYNYKDKIEFTSGWDKKWWVFKNLEDIVFFL